MPTTVKGFADGYLPNGFMETLYPGEPKQAILPLTLIPASGILVEGPRIRDINGREVNATAPNATYTFEFTVRAVGGLENVGLYLRLGQDAARPPAAIIGLNRADLGSSLLGIVGSSTYALNSCNSTPLAPHPVHPDFFNNNQRWVELNLTGGPNPVVHLVSFKVESLSSSASSLRLYYRAWAAARGVNNTLYYNHTPADAILGSNYTTSTRAWCQAQVFEKILPWNCGYLNGLACTSDPVCDTGLQVQGGRCLNAQVCGAQGDLCTGRTQCCNIGGVLTCQPSDQCPTPATCAAICDIGEYCDVSSLPAQCRDCTPGGTCTIDCGGEGEACCSVALSSSRGGCNSGLRCSTLAEQEDCSLQGIRFALVANNRIESSCTSIALLVNASDGQAQTPFEPDARCGPLSFTVRRGDTGQILSPSCFSISNNQLNYNGLSGGSVGPGNSCSFDLDAQGEVKRTELIFRYNCPTSPQVVLDTPLILLDPTDRPAPSQSLIAAPGAAGMCVDARQTRVYTHPAHFRDLGSSSRVDITTEPGSVTLSTQAYQWTPLSLLNTHPSPRSGHVMAYNSINDRVVLFGGHYAPHDLTATDYYADTWTFDPSTQSWTSVTPVHSPPLMFDLAMAFDSRRGVMVLFGQLISPPQPGTIVRETWEYNTATNTWTQIATTQWPGTSWNPYSPAMAFDPNRRVMIVYGAGALLYRDTWEYDPSKTPSERWTAIVKDGHPNYGPYSPTGALPQNLAGAAIVFDSKLGQAILFGGSFSARGTADTYWYNPSNPAAQRWVKVGTINTPPTRQAHSLIYDSVRNRTLLFGGSQGLRDQLYTGPFLGDMWEYDSVDSTWTKLSMNIVPSARFDTAVAFDSQRGQMVLFGGRANETVNNGPPYYEDTWLFSPTPSSSGTWTAHPPIDSGSTTTQWLNITWAQSLPPGTKIEVSVRSCTEPSCFGFSYQPAPLSCPDAECTFTLNTLPPGRYFQWQANLSTADPILSPVLSELNVTFLPS